MTDRPQRGARWVLAILVLGAASLALPAPARAFCGFFVAGSNARLTNNASQVVLLREGTRTSMTMSNTYQGPPENFAMVVPVPVVLQKEDVKTLPANVFEHIDQLSAPRLVEYWEQDPCYVERVYKSAPPMAAPAMAARKREAASDEADYGVKVEAQFAVGEYEIVILSANDSSGLDRWLRDNKYTIPEGAGAALAPYVRDQMKFFVAKVNIDKVMRDPQGVVVLSPLRVQYESKELRLPVRLGLLNAAAKQDLIVYVLNPSSRYEVANYTNVFAPTNVEVADEVRNDFAGFYATLFDETLARMNNKAVVTEYAWQTTSCDPCPTPPLSPSDIATLGARLPSAEESGGTVLTPAPRPGATPMAPPVPPPPFRRGRGVFGGFAPWVLTRMHTRYDKSSLSEDLIFREARPVMGGRATWEGGAADAGAAVQEVGVNNFQGRFIIRHYWSGPVACNNPRYGRWGGPPGGGPSRPMAARGLATAARGKIALGKVVRTPVPSLGLPGQPPPRRK